MAQPARMPKLKFRWMKCYTWGGNYRMPNGHHLATVEEVRNQFNTIESLGILPLHRHNEDSIYGGAKMYLLDGYMIYPSHDHFEIQSIFLNQTLDIKVVVKEIIWESWYEDAGRWRKRSSAYYSSYGFLLRKQFYNHITLFQQIRQIDLSNDDRECLDLDMVYWIIEAAVENNVEMVWELLNRRVDIDDLQDPQSIPWVTNVMRQLDLLKEHGRDQPSMEDKLGRHVFAQGLASLFLNRFIESPITVGICGEWGMGKSSLMIQGPFVTMLKEYKPQYYSVYKSLACMDSCQMLDSQQSHALGRVPGILTVQYNTWQYHDQHEAWAGLAVTITKEMEKSMTRAQWFSTGWRYSWNKNNVNICFQVLLPCILAAFLASWIAWAAWILLKEHKFQGLKYGSIPLTIMITLWIVLKSIISIVKPVSVQMMGYITAPDHTSRLGYQEQVISDINFLKTELGKRPHWFFSLILGAWCWKWFGLYFNSVENTSIRRFSPAEDQLRIITFVDDLDRCEEKVILEVLSAVNLVLARCKINVVVGIDKEMIERAIRRSFEDAEDIDIADKFMCKIIQIPLSLQDPKEDKMNNFLKYQWGREVEPQTRSSFQDEDDTDYGTSDDDAENRVVDIHCCDPLVSNCRGIIGKAYNWLSYFLKIPYSIGKISSELPKQRDVLDKVEMYPLTFSKGARLTREMLITKYTEAEADTFENFKVLATGDRKLPREWKRLFNYHRLAWNVLIKRGDIYCLLTWKVELVAWIFVCWQWKHEMNTIIKGWSKYTELETTSTKQLLWR